MIVRDLMSVKEVAAMTGLTEDFFSKLRSVGGGPIFYKISAKCVRYHRNDVEAWLDERRRTSTFDERVAA